MMDIGFYNYLNKICNLNVNKNILLGIFIINLNGRERSGVVVILMDYYSCINSI